MNLLPEIEAADELSRYVAAAMSAEDVQPAEPMAARSNMVRGH